MRDVGHHVSSVDRWLDGVGAGLSSAALVSLFDDAIARLTTRIRATLGEVTLTAIVGRVLRNASDKYPNLSVLEADPSGQVKFSGLTDNCRDIDPADLRHALRFVMIELLTVIGNLTAEILTEDLHSELGKVKAPKRSRRKSKKAGESYEV